MKKTKILITGASGCVGQYIVDWLLKNSNADLLLWIRDPNKLTAIPTNHSRVRLLVGDLRNPEKFKEELLSINRLIHTATAWGDPIRTEEVNVKSVHKILGLLNEDVIEQIIYFSTASILNHELQPLKEAYSYGTEYIQSKAKCLEKLNSHYLARKIIAVFPTLVFGGDIEQKSEFPSSYLTSGLKEASKWLWLARWLKAYSRFHFIHAADIAFICGHLATSPIEDNCQGIRKLVLAQPEISIDSAIDSLCDWKGIKKTPKIPLRKWLIKILIKVLPIKLSDWDTFSINQHHFTHNPITTPETFGGVSYASSLKDILMSSGLPKQNIGEKRGKLL